MLSASSAEVVKATLPAIGAAIGDITPLFYSKMFAAHPDLERDLFNRGNQAAGDQPRALAGAIAVYASVLVDDDAPHPSVLLSRIAHKHASLGITEAQYQIVHDHLFAAIVDVLGEAVTPEVAAAWDEVYWLMARDLIAIEAGLYDLADVTAETVFSDVVVKERRQESPNTISLVLTAADGSPLPAGRPGQYVSVAVRLRDGARQIRQYSLTGEHGEGEWAISVKRIDAHVAEDGTEVPAGEVSTFLHNEVFEGDVLSVSYPFGDLVLEEGGSAPLMLVSAGIGTTPIIGMLHHLSRQGTRRPVTVVHADRSPSGHALRSQLKSLVGTIESATLHRWYEDLGTRAPREDLAAGLVDLDSLTVPENTEVYLCGPLPFMERVRDGLVARGLEQEAIRYEVFGPDKWLASA